MIARCINIAARVVRGKENKEGRGLGNYICIHSLSYDPTSRTTKTLSMASAHSIYAVPASRSACIAHWNASNFRKLRFCSEEKGKKEKQTWGLISCPQWNGSKSVTNLRLSYHRSQDRRKQRLTSVLLEHNTRTTANGKARHWVRHTLSPKRGPVSE